ncbi:MAG: hypothetical protein HQL90_15610 [Magnetococcales bacterium]|nr:hypothetical protein [Magnetococcales bacterium]
MAQYAFNPLARHLDLVNNPAHTAFVVETMVGGQRMVILNQQGKLLHADHTIPDHAGRIVGLTLTSGVAGATVIVCRFGLVVDPAWQWDAAKPRLFLSSNGTLTQTVPTTGFVCVVGHCISATQLFIDIQPAINLT